MKTCVVCGNQMPDDAAVCSRCGFPVYQRYFLSEKHYRAWVRDIIEPCRQDWHRREIEQQRKLLEEQRRELEEQKRLFEEQRKSAEQNKPPKKTQKTPDVDFKNSGWNTDTGKKEKLKKDQQMKKKGGFVKNALIAVVVFVLAGAVGKNLIAPNLASSADSDSTALSSDIAESSVLTPFPLAAVKEDELTRKEVNEYGEELGVDLYLFENLPMESVDAAQQWLNENDYHYGISEEELTITPKIGLENDWVAIYIGDYSDKGGDGALLSMYTQGEHLSASQLDTLDTVMSSLHLRGWSLDGETWHYYDGNEQYYLAENCVQKTCFREFSDERIRTEMETILPLLTEWDRSDGQSITDWLTENHYAWELNEDGSKYTITAGSWEVTLSEYKMLSLYRHMGNPDELFQEMKSRLIQMGFTTKEEKTERLSGEPEDTGVSYVCQKGETEIEMKCDLSMHRIQIWNFNFG